MQQDHLGSNEKLKSIRVTTLFSVDLSVLADFKSYIVSWWKSARQVCTHINLCMCVCLSTYVLLFTNSKQRATVSQHPKQALKPRSCAKRLPE